MKAKQKNREDYMLSYLNYTCKHSFNIGKDKTQQKEELKQTNQTVDCLARLGSQQDQDLVVSSTIPFAVREFALVDAMGVGHLRI